jgi:anaerobic selenocysteine-containing dehydrogenase
MPQETHHTSCIMDCPDTCALEVTVDNGKVTKIAGANGHPDTNGIICTKVARYAQRLYHADRLLYPMKRIGAKGEGKFERIAWDEAIATITQKFREIKSEWGSEAILPYHYGGSNGLLGDEFVDDYFFAKLGASRLDKTICAAPSTAVATGMYGKMPGVAFEDYVEAKCIIIWGANPKASNIHLVPYLREAKKRGAFIAVVDPTRTFSVREADLHIPVYPGTDLPLALALIKLWHENDQLDRQFLARHADEIEPLLEAATLWPVERAAKEARISGNAILQLATVYAETNPAIIRAGWGTERNRNGGQALAAILAMPALLGKFGIRGGGYTMSNSGAAKLDVYKIFGECEWNTRQINMTQLGEVLTNGLNPPIKAMFVYNCNPAVTVPDQNSVLRGLAREDLFTVVFEQVITDTARYADILLPAATFLEQHEIRKGYGSYVIGGIIPVIDSCGEARPNEIVFAELGRAMGWQDEVFTRGTKKFMRDAIEALDLRGGKADATLLENGKVQRITFDGHNPLQFKNVFPRTPDGKINLTPDSLGKQPYHFVPLQDEKYPLAMISPANNKMVSSTLGEFNYPKLSALIHPADADIRGIKTGDAIRIFNDLGEVICRAQVSDKIRDGVISMPKGAWLKSSQNSRVSTALCPATINEVAGGACFNDARVEVLKTS